MTPLTLVLDTNVVLDWLIYQDPRIAFLDGALERQLVTLASETRCLTELLDVLSRPALKVAPERREIALERYRRSVQMFEQEAGSILEKRALPQCRDVDDQVFVELAVSCRAFAIVTRDKELLRMHHGLMLSYQLQVVEPAQMGKLLAG